MKVFRLIPLLLLLSVWSCTREGVKDPALTKVQVDRLTSLAHDLDDMRLSQEAQTKAWEQFEQLSYQETEALIDLRYEDNLQTKVVDAGRAKALRDLRHSVNRQAYKMKGRSFYQLNFADSEEVLVSLGRRTAAARDDKNTGSLAEVPAAPGGRTSIEGGTCPTGCIAWVPSPYAVSFASNYAYAAKWFPGEYKGLRTIESGGLCQDDCDYLFWFTFSKVYYTKYILRRGNANITIGIEGSSWPARMTNNTPPYNSDCGTWTQEVILGKDRTDIWYSTPQYAASQIELAVVLAIDTGYCRVGTRLYLVGRFYKNITQAEAPAYQQCTCIEENIYYVR